MRQFPAQHPNSVVLILGCGLDTRAYRINPPPSVHWINLDFPEVIELRRKLFSDHGSYQMVGGSLAGTAWLEVIPRDGPLRTIGDGAFEYPSEEQVRRLLRRLTDRFDWSEIVFGTRNSHAVAVGSAKLGDRSSTRLRRPAGDLGAVDALNLRLKRTATGALLGSRCAPWTHRLVYWMVPLRPELLDSVRILRYEF